MSWHYVTGTGLKTLRLTLEEYELYTKEEQALHRKWYRRIIKKRGYYWDSDEKYHARPEPDFWS